MSRILFTAIIIKVLVLSSVSFGYSGGSGTPEDPYQTATKADLLALADTAEDYNKCFILTADINMQGQVFTTAIIAADIVAGNNFEGTAFTGTFDGNGHKITNFTINGGSNSFLGLFGYIISSGGKVKNLGLENCAVTGLSDSYHVGGLVGVNYGSISDCYSTGSVSGYSLVGGLVGVNYGNITNCYSTGAVSSAYLVGGLVGGNGGGISNCYSTGTVSGSSNYVGGLVGENRGSISDCYSTGSVSGYSLVGGLVGYNFYGSISRCYSTGSVSGGAKVGGLVGYNNSGTITNCFWDIQTSGWTTSAGGTGLNTAQMMQQASFTGWDFMTIWAICEGTNYPRLTWQIPAADFTCPDGVNMEDLDYFVQRWLLSDCASSNNCDGADMDGSGEVDFADFAIFADNWLKQN